MNILMITGTYSPSANGVAISTARSVSELRRKGHTVLVIGPHRPGVVHDGYLSFPTSHGLPFMPADYPLVLPFLASNLKNSLSGRNWDVIHVHHPSVVARFALDVRRTLDVPMVFTYHTTYDTYIDNLFRWLPNLFRQRIYQSEILSVLEKMDALLATTRWLEKDLKRRFTNPIYHVTTAGLTHTYLSHENKTKLRRIRQLPVNEPVFITVSRLTRLKNLHILIDAFAHWFKLRKKGYLIVVGDGEARSALEQQAKKIGVEQRVRFVGKIHNQDLPPWYSLADVFLYSSMTDTIGVNIIEAMSAGLPVVAIDHISSREVINTSNGVLVKNHPDAFARGMLQALRCKIKLSHGALATAKNYSIEKTTDVLLKTYTQVIYDFKRR